MTDRLLVYKDGRVVGRLERDREMTFAYTEEVIAEHSGEILVSASLKVRLRPFTERELLPFFDGLLPEGSARERLATRFQLDYGDVFGLLRQLGRDCAGALSILPEDQDPEESAQEGVIWLDDEALANLVDNLDTAPLGVQPEMDVRLSLAGVQDKLVLVLNPETGAMGLPRGTTPSTHILKPAPKAKFPGLVLNEAYCSVLAFEAALSVAEVDLINVREQPALLVRRYDRARVGDAVKRVHQEDFCQALHVPSHRKYQSDGGPDLRRMVDFLNRTSTDAATDIERLLDWVAFNYLTGNADGHAKNVAMIYGDQDRLAPAYDLVCTEMFSGLSRRMGQSIGGEYEAKRITLNHWEREFGNLGLNSGLFTGRLATLAERVASALPRAEGWLQARGLWIDALDIVPRLVRERGPKLKD